MSRPKSAVLSKSQKDLLRDQRDYLKMKLAEHNRAVKVTEKELAAVNKKLKG